MLGRIAAAAYGVVAYVVFLGSFTYTIGFLGNVGVPKGVDDGATGAVATAVVVNLALLSLFAVQHSVMARPWFKRAWTKIVPPAIERSTYVLAASGVIVLLLWQWRPLPDFVWSVGPEWARGLLWALYGSGWVILLASTFMIGHFDMFGLKQVLARWQQRRYSDVEFRTPGFYKLVQHPLYVGFLISFWATPDMSQGRLLFAAVASAYILVAVRFEEHDLRNELGAEYARYAQEVPRFIPSPSAGLVAAPRPRAH